ncbi:NAD-dependent succinate-semialdehyde dehydrogenase, partial [Clavibacter michiganensis]
MTASTETDLLSGTPTTLLIGGEQVDAEGDATFEVRDPATDAVIARVADASPADGARALDAAVAAQAA